MIHVGSTLMIPKQEYDLLKSKADLFDRYVETEELTKEELAIIKEALKGPFMTKSAFLKKHSDLT